MTVITKIITKISQKPSLKSHAILLSCSVSLLSSPAIAQTYDGIYRGNGTVVSGWDCIGDSYQIEMEVSGSRFDALVSRRGGEQPSSQYTMSGSVDSSGRINDSRNEGEGSALFFQGRIIGRAAIGGSGAYTQNSACVWMFELIRPEPTPYSGVLGDIGYYRFRYDDFVSGNSGMEPPDYYLGFGERYLTRFMNETYPNLTPQGQEFLRRVGETLQQKIEDKLNNNPQSFAELERDSDEFRKFAYDTHPDAYCESGWGNLPESDRDQIIEAVDRSDLYFSIEGIITGVQLATRCGSFRDALPW